MKHITLTNGKKAIVDDRDYENLICYKWYITFSRNWKPYVRRYENGKTIYMARELCAPPMGYVVDHINGDTLDNRRENLRVCMQSENNRNRIPNRNRTHSRFKGVTMDKSRGRWRAYIYLGGKCKHLGMFDTPEFAAMAYDQSAVKEFGEYARLNFPTAK